MNWLLDQDQSVTRIIPLQFCNIVGAYKSMTEFRRMEVHIVPTMVECHLNKKPFLINGNDYATVDGTPSRDYVNILDVADYVMHLMTQLMLDSKVVHNGIIHVGTGVTTTTLQMVNKFKNTVGELDYTIGPRRAFDTGSIVCPTDNLRNFRNGKVTLIDKSLVDEATTLLILLAL
jgi:UDP-glucose 4-epimerase